MEKDTQDGSLTYMIKYTHTLKGRGKAAATEGQD